MWHPVFVPFKLVSPFHPLSSSPSPSLFTHNAANPSSPLPHSLTNTFCAESNLQNPLSALFSISLLVLRSGLSPLFKPTLCPGILERNPQKSLGKGRIKKVTCLICFEKITFQCDLSENGLHSSYSRCHAPSLILRIQLPWEREKSTNLSSSKRQITNCWCRQSSGEGASSSDARKSLETLQVTVKVLVLKL